MMIKRVKQKRVVLALAIFFAVLIISAVLYLIIRQGQDTKTIRGVVTSVNIDCGGRSERLEDGRRLVSRTRICDGPDSFSVGGTVIYASSGYAPDFWSKEINSVHAGDEAEVKYIVNKADGQESASLNCDTCYAKVLKSFQGGSTELRGDQLR